MLNFKTKMMPEIIRIKDLSKNFGKTVVLKGINLSIFKGETFGLLGPNAAGKTTLIRCLLKLLEVSQGDIYFQDKPLDSQTIQREFGFLPENFLPYPYLSSWELLRLLATHNKDKDNIDSLLEIVDLRASKHRYIKEYSRGMLQRLGIALALLNDPQVLVLDEPTLGLDPLGQRQILGLLSNLKSKGRTIFFSSHILSQVERVCDRIGIISDGKMVFLGSIPELLNFKNAASLEEGFISVLDSYK